MSEVLFWELVAPDKGRVNAVCHKPQILSAEEKAKGLTVEFRPQPPRVAGAGETAVLYVKPSTGELTYEYEARAKTTEELLAEVVAQNAQILALLARVLEAR